MAQQKETVARTITVAFLVCLVCAVVVSSAAVLLRPVQQANKTLDRQTNILAAAGMYEPGMSAKEVRDAFETVERRFVDLNTGKYVDMPASYDMRQAATDPDMSTTLSVENDPASINRRVKVAEVYLARDQDGNLTRIILPVHGYGLWSTLYGFLALKPDANTVAGLGFYEHAETPGLGGKVDDPSWKAQWPGKKLYDADGDVAIQVIKGQVEKGDPEREHKVDGLSGATLTTNGVNNLIRYWVGENGYGPYLDRMAERYPQQTAEAN